MRGGRLYLHIWPTGCLPYLIAPHGRKLPLILRGYIPYISLGSPECEPINDSEVRNILRLLARPQVKIVSTTDKSVLRISEESGDESEELIPDDVKTTV